MLQGHRVKARRDYLGLTQPELGKLIDKDYQYVSKLERGVYTNVTTDTLEHLARALVCSADYLLGLADDPRPPTRRKPTAAPVG